MLEPIPGEKPMDSSRSQSIGENSLQKWERKLDGKASLSIIERDGKQIRVVAAEHFSEQAAKYFEINISGEIVNPQDWYFLVEGKDSGIHECAIAKEIAERKKIPIEDPIFHPFQTEIIEMYLTSEQAGKFPREILMGKLGGILSSVRGTMDLEEIATILGVSNPQELYLNMILASLEKTKDPEQYSARSKQMFDDLVKISNAISTQVLDYYLRQNPTKKNVVLYVGEAHEGIVEMNLSQIPENLRLSDSQIKDLLIRREKARIAQVLRTYGIKLTSDEELSPVLKTFTGRVQQSKEQVEHGRITELLNKMPDIPENLKNIINKWSDNLFDLKYVRGVGYQQYLKSDSSLHQIWGAAALLADKVDLAKSENRDLTFEEMAEVKDAFLKASNRRRKDAGMFSGQGDELEELSKSIDTLAKIIKRIE